jgi:hypothetical protein
MISTIPEYVDKDSHRRRKAIFLLLKELGIMLEKEEDVPDRAVFMLRFVPIGMLMSHLICSKVSEGFSYNQITKKYPVTIREVRTNVKRFRKLHNVLLFKGKV